MNKNIPQTVRLIPREAILSCPHVILSPDHYRYDNTCRCDDPAHVEMLGYGYVWNELQKKWSSPK